MRRKDREMGEAFALEIADKCEWAVVSMVDEEGLPYAVPVSIVRVEDAVYFHCAKQGKKIDCMRKKPQVTVVCVGNTRRLETEFSTEYESAIIQGTASEVTEDAEKVHILYLLCQRHTPKHMDAFDQEVSRSLPVTGLYKIHIDSITGKRKKYDAEGKEMKSGRIE